MVRGAWRTRRRRAIGAAIGLSAFGLAAVGIAGAAAAQDDDVASEFFELPSSALLELYADVGNELRARGVIGDDAPPEQDYAEFLASGALELDSAGVGVGKDKSGAVYRIIGVRRAAPDAPARTRPLGDLAGAPFDHLALLVFERNFEVSHAVVMPYDQVVGMASGGGAAGPSLSITDELLETPELRDFLNRVNRLTFEADR